MKTTEALEHLAEVCSGTGTCEGCPLLDPKVDGCILREYPPYMFSATASFKNIKGMEALVEEKRQDKASCSTCELSYECELEDIKAGLIFRPDQDPCRQYRPVKK